MSSTFRFFFVHSWRAAPHACRAHCPFVRIVCHPSTGYPARSGGSACDSPRWHGFFLARPPSFARRRPALRAPSNRRNLSSSRHRNNRLRHSQLLPSNRLSQRLRQPPSRPKPKSQPSDLPLLNLPITPSCSWCKATTNLGTCASAFEAPNVLTGLVIRRFPWNPPRLSAKAQTILGLTTPKTLRPVPLSLCISRGNRALIQQLPPNLPSPPPWSTRRSVQRRAAPGSPPNSSPKSTISPPTMTTRPKTSPPLRPSRTSSRPSTSLTSMAPAS
jgi:hypothetical protein